MHIIVSSYKNGPSVNAFVMALKWVLEVMGLWAKLVQITISMMVATSPTCEDTFPLLQEPRDWLKKSITESNKF